MDELIKQLEKATGPARELDRLLAVVAGLTWGEGDTYDNPCLNWKHSNNTAYNVVRHHIMLGCPRFTESIDAAVTLVPEGMCWCITSGHSAVASVFYSTDKSADKAEFVGAATPALALCLASIKKRPGVLTARPKLAHTHNEKI